MIYLLIIGLIISWRIPVDGFIEGAIIEHSMDGGIEYSLLATVPVPDSSVVIPDPPCGIRARYRGVFFSSGGPGPYGRIGSALVLDFTGGVLPEYTIMDTSLSRWNSGADILVVYRPRTPWVSSWRGPGDPRGPEIVRYRSVLDFNGDGIHDLSDLTLIPPGMGTETVLALFEVYGSPAEYEWRAK